MSLVILYFNVFFLSVGGIQMLQHNIKKYVHVGLLSFVHDKQLIRSNIDNNMIFNFIKSTLTS